MKRPAEVIVRMQSDRTIVLKRQLPLGKALKRAEKINRESERSELGCVAVVIVRPCSRRKKA